MSKITKLPTKSMGDVLKEYDRLREEEKLIKARKDELAKEIKQYAEKNGTTDGSGSMYCENEEYVFGQQCKKSVSFKNDEAIKFFEENDFNECVKVVKTIDEDEVEKALLNGELSQSDLEDITSVKVSYSVMVKKKEVVEDEVENVKVAKRASKKISKRK